LAAFDVRVFLYLHHALSSWLGVAAFLSAIGGGWGALLLVPLWASARFRGTARALSYVLVLNAVVVFGLKRVVARARPCNCLPDVHALVFGTPTDFSFPSGHAAGSFSFCVFFAVLLWRSARLPRSWRLAGSSALVLLATGVALSRVALGVHFPGDVLVGAIVGATIGGVGAELYLRSASPMPAEADKTAQIRG